MGEFSHKVGWQLVHIHCAWLASFIYPLSNPSSGLILQNEKELGTCPLWLSNPMKDTNSQMLINSVWCIPQHGHRKTLQEGLREEMPVSSLYRVGGGESQGKLQRNWQPDRLHMRWHHRLGETSVSKMGPICAKGTKTETKWMEFSAPHYHLTPMHDRGVTALMLSLPDAWHILHTSFILLVLTLASACSWSVTDNTRWKNKQSFLKLLYKESSFEHSRWNGCN